MSLKWCTCFISRDTEEETHLQQGDQLRYFPSGHQRKGRILFTRGESELRLVRNKGRHDPHTLPTWVYCADEQDFMLVAEMIAAAANLGIEFDPFNRETEYYICTLIAKT